VPAAPLFQAEFLKPLTLPNAEVFARILAELYAESRRAAQPLGRDTALDIVITHTLAPADDDPLASAQAVLNDLEASGWLRTEVQPDYTPSIALTPRAFQFLQAAQATAPAITELLVTIHDLLKSALMDVDNDARLAAAARLTYQLVDTLKSLQHTTTPNPLPDTARLRAGILEAASKLEARGPSPARIVRQEFQAVDTLFDDIASRRLKAANTDTQPSALAGSLRAVIAKLATADRKVFIKNTETLITLYNVPPHTEPAAADQVTTSQSSPSSSETSTQSVQSPREASNSPASTFTPIDYPLPSHTPADIIAARVRVQQLLNRPVSPDRVQRLARQFIEGKAHARAADLIAEGRADLPLIIQIRLHAEDSLGYSIEEQQWVEINNLVFRDYLIKNPDYIEPPAPEEEIIIIDDVGLLDAPAAQAIDIDIDGEPSE
jgi:hypothetical protein